jgi:cytochrome c
VIGAMWRQNQEEDVNKLLAMTAALFLFAGPALADELRATEADANALVKNAVTYLKRHGPEKAYKEFGKKNGPFVYRDLYVVVLDMNGNVLAHGDKADWVGQNLMSLKDPDGKEYVRERIEMARASPVGTQTFKRKNPATGQTEIRIFHYERVEDVIVGSGSFRQIVK